MTSYAVLTKDGGRPINEDSVQVGSDGARQLFVLADGLGGHGAGEIASAIAVEQALLEFEKRLPADEQLPSSILAGQNALIEEQRRTARKNDLKTTITVLMLYDNKARWAHVGDSRIYWFKGFKQAERTLDHSVPQMLVNTGEIEEKDIRFHEDRNRLTRVMGMEWDTPRYSLSEEVTIAPPTSFLLCSDGFWELIDEQEMFRQLRRSATPEEWLDRMEQIVLQNGSSKRMDNYSAIGVFVR
jgi:serine/threonine protein phosphatase PrpC